MEDKAFIGSQLCTLAKISLLCTAAWASPVLAQSAVGAPTDATAADAAAADSAVSAPGEILVTAQKRTQSTQDVGMSIAAVSGEELRTLGIEEVKDIAKIVPGFTVAQSFRGPPIYTLRGVGFNTPNMSTSSPVGVYIDEAAFPYPIMTVGTAFDLERVEVLKGPQGTLYGRNTTGGLINSIARKPTDFTEGYVRVNYGSYESYGLDAAVGGKLTEGLNSRLAFTLQRSDKGWQRHIVTGDRLGKVDKMGARLAFDMHPFDGVKLLLTGTWVRDKSDTMAGQSIFTYAKGLAAAGIPQDQWVAVGTSLGLPPEFFTQAFTPEKASQAQWATSQPQWGGTAGGRNFTPSPIGQLDKDNELFALSLRGELELSSNVTLTTLTSYAHFDRDETADVAGVNLEAAVTRQLGYIKSFSQEVRLSGDTDQLNWIVGGFYARDRTQEIDKNWGAYVTDIVPLRALGAAFMPAGSSQAQIDDVRWGFRDWQNEAKQTVETRALFGQGELKVIPDVSVTLGARYTSDRTRFAGCSRDQGDGAIAATWNGFFNNYLGIPANVQPGGCVTYLDDLAPYLTPNPAFVPLANPPAFLVNPAAGAFPAQGVVRRTLKENNLSGRLGVDWKVDPGVMVYGYMARGYKSGAFPNVSANVASQYDPAKQERLTAIEAGVKSRPAPGFILNASAFYYDYRNKQVYGYVPDIVYGTLNRIVNIPKSYIYGAELEVGLPLAEGLNLRGSATYLKTKIKDYVGYDDFGIPRDFAGATFTFTPSLQASAILTYKRPLSDDWDLGVTLSSRYSSKAHADLLKDPRFDIDPYVLLDASIDLVKDERFTINFFVNNITDKYYWSSAQYYEDNLVRFAGMPRTWGVALEVGF